MANHPAVVERLARLQVDQRRAATAPPGPVLCVAPAGSGKTTTLVARIAWLIDQGAQPETVCAITFNRRAADELRKRVAVAVQPLGAGLAERVRIRTFHALGLEMLREAGEPTEPLVDRDEILRAVRPDASAAERRRLDTLMSRFKLDLDVDSSEIERTPDAGPVARTYVAYAPRSGVAAGSTSTTSSPTPFACSSEMATSSRAGAIAAGTRSSTRPRTWIAPSSGSRCCWRPRPIRSFSSATTTSRSS